MILPGGTIGVIGGGQLGRMLAMEARRMGYRTVVLDPAEHGPAAQVSDEHIRARLDDLDAARELARLSDVVTLEWENADVRMVREMSDHVPVRPDAGVLEVAQHRVREKSAAQSLGLSTVAFRAVRSLEDLHAALAEIGTPAILKTARGGYDGRGQARIDSPADAEDAFAALAGDEPDLILEERVAFRMEASVICARSSSGEISTFPISENIHSGGILDATVVPARLPPELLQEATAVGQAMSEGLGSVGLLTVELFVTEDDRVLVNEIAPRPHNSGHYTWDACSVSQFEQQLRATCDLPLASPVLLRPAAMVNLLGEHMGDGRPDQIAGALRVHMASLHLYGKQHGRPGRKMGHITTMGETVEEALDHALQARARLTSDLDRNEGGGAEV